jgi:hypothetical protein
MAKPFTISVQGLDKLQKRMQTASAKIRKEIGGELKDSANKINAKQIRLVPVDEGGTKQATVVRKVNDLSQELLASKHSTPFMEFGTKKKVRIPSELQDYAKQFNLKGPNIGFDAFFLIILAWVRRKGIAGRYSTKTRRRIGGANQQLQEDFSAAWPIALSILRNGVNPHPFFFAPYFEERPKIVERVKKILDDI